MPADLDYEKRPENDASIHDQVLIQVLCFLLILYCNVYTFLAILLKLSDFF